jgi:transglutaminase-like putative cysteine protease
MFQPLANPRRATMAMAIEHYFDVSLYLLVLTGFGTLASTGGLDTLAVVVVACALSLRGYHLVTHQGVTIPERWTTYLTLLYVGIYFADYVFVSRTFLVATVHLVLFGMVIRLFSLQRARDHFMLAVLSFLMVLAAAVLTVDSVFLLFFALFLLVAVVTFVLMEMRHSVAEDNGRAQEPKDSAPYRRMGNVLFASAPMLMLMILAGASVIFFLLPRVSSRYLSGYSPSSDLSTGFSDHVQLGRIGEIQQSSAVVMHVRIEDDLAGAYDLRWRGIALSQFDGRVWSNPFLQTDLRFTGIGRYSLGNSGGKSSRSSARNIRYHVVMEPMGTNVFFLAEKPAALIGTFAHVTTDSGGAVYNLDSEHPVSQYDAESQLSEPDLGALRIAPNTVPGTLTHYLNTPPLDPRITKLAEEITASSPTNYDKAVTMERYLRTHFGYTLDLGRIPPRNPLVYFLFERKAGHCEYFASSMAIMLRSLRIPSRIVTGFRGGEFNDLTGQYVVRASNAHSWVEAYFPGNGWVSFDPTPGGDLETHSGWSRLSLYVDAAASFWREWVINFDVSHQRSLGENVGQNSRKWYNGLREWYARNYQSLLESARRTHQKISQAPGRWMVGSVVAAGMLLLLFNFRQFVQGLTNRRLRSNPGRAPRQSASLWYDRMLRRLARHGWRKAPGQTPCDFVAAIQEPQLQKKVAIFTRAYESARFGQSVDDARALPELYEEIVAVER